MKNKLPNHTFVRGNFTQSQAVKIYLLSCEGIERPGIISNLTCSGYYGLSNNKIVHSDSWRVEDETISYISFDEFEVLIK